MAAVVSSARARWAQHSLLALWRLCWRHINTSASVHQGGLQVLRVGTWGAGQHHRQGKRPSIIGGSIGGISIGIGGTAWAGRGCLAEEEVYGLLLEKGGYGSLFDFHFK